MPEVDVSPANLIPAWSREDSAVLARPQAVSLFHTHGLHSE